MERLTIEIVPEAGR